ncbi:MAG TPA: hypothetical protein VG389_01220 [Myxococcota bacterium]|nr:hypothetical protein [Myxococcota bacterium]
MDAPRDALEALRRASVRSPADPAPWRRLGRAYLHRGDLCAAERALARAHALDLGDRETLQRLHALVPRYARWEAQPVPPTPGARYRRLLAAHPLRAEVLVELEPGVVALLDVANGAVRVRLGGFDRQVYAAAIDPGGRRLALSPDDHTTRLYDLEGGTPLALLRELGHALEVAFSADGRLLAAARADALAWWTVLDARPWIEPRGNVIGPTGPRTPLRLVDGIDHPFVHAGEGRAVWWFAGNGAGRIVARSAGAARVPSIWVVAAEAAAAVLDGAPPAGIPLHVAWDAPWVSFAPNPLVVAVAQPAVDLSGLGLHGGEPGEVRFFDATSGAALGEIAADAPCAFLPSTGQLVTDCVGRGLLCWSCQAAPGNATMSGA